MLLLGTLIAFLHQVLQLIALGSPSYMSLHLASKYVASTKVASHMTQLTSPTSFWLTFKDLPKLLISNLLLKTPSIFTRALTSNYCNGTLPNNRLNRINSGSSPTARAHNISTNCGRFLCSSTNTDFVTRGGGQVRTYERSN